MGRAAVDPGQVPGAVTTEVDAKAERERLERQFAPLLAKVGELARAAAQMRYVCDAAKERVAASREVRAIWSSASIERLARAERALEDAVTVMEGGEHGQRR